MERQIEFGEWYEIDGPCGTEWVPADVAGDVDVSGFDRGPIPAALADYCENKTAHSIRKTTGYGARLSAPGYLDCTEWSVFETEAAAQEYLDEMYGDDEDETA